jgi:hypothetical protein
LKGEFESVIQILRRLTLCWVLKRYVDYRTQVRQEKRGSPSRKAWNFSPRHPCPALLPLENNRWFSMVPRKPLLSNNNIRTRRMLDSKKTVLYCTVQRKGWLHWHPEYLINTVSDGPPGLVRAKRETTRRWHPTMHLKSAVVVKKRFPASLASIIYYVLKISRESWRRIHVHPGASHIP